MLGQGYFLFSNVHIHSDGSVVVKAACAGSYTSETQRIRRYREGVTTFHSALLSQYVWVGGRKYCTAVGIHSD